MYTERVCAINTFIFRCDTHRRERKVPAVPLYKCDCVSPEMSLLYPERTGRPGRERGVICPGPDCALRALLDGGGTLVALTPCSDSQVR